MKENFHAEINALSKDNYVSKRVFFLCVDCFGDFLEKNLTLARECAALQGGKKDLFVPAKPASWLLKLQHIYIYRHLHFEEQCNVSVHNLHGAFSATLHVHFRGNGSYS